MPPSLDIEARSLALHRRLAGKLAVFPRHEVRSTDDLALLYTPGVAEACRVIAENTSEIYNLTGRRNTIAVISDGTAVLGLGDIGPEAALPVMEGKSLLFKVFAGIDAVPLCVREKTVAGLAALSRALAPSFGGINFEDIGAPVCFDLEQELAGSIDIPIFHDDQHGTAVVVAAGLHNALKLTGRSLATARIVINGIGAAGSAIARFLMNQGSTRLSLCDRHGLLNPHDPASLVLSHHRALAELTNPGGAAGSLAEVLQGADVFIGVSRGNILDRRSIGNMAPRPIVFALANPTSEIDPVVALEAGAAVVATGRSDFPNQVNNVLAFPGIFRGALDVEASSINEPMKQAASQALADCVGAPHPECIIPSPLQDDVAFRVALATAKAAIASGVARRVLADHILTEVLRARIAEGQGTGTAARG